MPTETLPWMGLGLSSNLSARARPHPYRLHDAEPGAFDYVEYSAPLPLSEARRQASLFAEMWERRGELPVLLHPVHLNLYGPRLEDDAAVEALSEHALAVDARWVGNDVAWWHTGGCFFPGHLYVAPPLSRTGLDACVAHVAHVQQRLAVPLVVENPAVIARRGPLHVLEFMAALAERTGAELLLDLGHLLSHQLACGLPLDAGLERFPLERVVEIHIAGGVVTRRGARSVYVDDHAQPVRPELFDLLEQLVPACPRLCAVTYEGDGHTAAQALADLQRLRRLVPAPGAAPHAPTVGRTPTVRSEARIGREALAAHPWPVFRACYSGGDADEPDPDGAEAERALRALAVAERIDRAFPLTRLLLAGDRDGLTAFTASPEFREGFASDGGASPAMRPVRDSPQQFARYARRRVREGDDEALATLVAFETWVLDRLHEATARRRGAKAPAAPPDGAAPEAHEVVARFPLDLSAVLQAAETLRSGPPVRPVGADATPPPGVALRRLLRSAPARPWRVGIRHRGGRVCVRSLDAPSAGATPPERGNDQPDGVPAPSRCVGAGASRWERCSPVSSSIRPHAISSPESPDGWLR